MAMGPLEQALTETLVLYKLESVAWFTYVDLFSTLKLNMLLLYKQMVSVA